MFALLTQITATPAPEAAAETVEVITIFNVVFATPQMKLIAIFLAADIILGTAAAIAAKTFNFNKLATFMATGVLPYLFGFAIVEMVAANFAVFGQMARIVVFVAIILNLLGSIISNLANLGVNMPPILKKNI